MWFGNLKTNVSNDILLRYIILTHIAQLDYIYDWMDDLLEKDEGIYVCTQTTSDPVGS